MNTCNSTSAFNNTNSVIQMLPPQRTTMNASALTWSDKIEERLNHLVSLQNGWDGYSGKPVIFANALFAVNMLQLICKDNTPCPSIVPGTSGDLQIEWHENDVDIELHILAPYEVKAWINYNYNSNDESELDLTNDFSNIMDWVKKLETGQPHGKAATA